MKYIIIVEDEPWLGDIFGLAFRKAGYEVRVCMDANAALDAIDDRVPDILLLDIMLGGPNGIQLLQELRSYADTMDLPIVVCSNADVATVKKSLLEYGVKAVLEKDLLSPQQLVKEVQKYA